MASDYVNPGGKTGVKAEFSDTTGGRWAFYNCRHGGLLSISAATEVKTLNSDFKAFGSPRGYAYGLENQDDQLGFVSDYTPRDRQEDAWRDHYTEQIFDQVLSVPEKIRAYVHVQQSVAQTDVTEIVQAKYHNRLVTPLGPYSTLFGEQASSAEKTLKVKLHDWRDGVMKYLEFSHDTDLDLTGSRSHQGRHE